MSTSWLPQRYAWCAEFSVALQPHRPWRLWGTQDNSVNFLTVLERWDMLKSFRCFYTWDVYMYIDFRSCFCCCVFFTGNRNVLAVQSLESCLNLLSLGSFFFVPTKENKALSLQCWLFVDRCDLWALTLAQWLSATWTSSQTSWICPSVGTGRSVLVSVYLLVFFIFFIVAVLLWPSLLHHW